MILFKLILYRHTNDSKTFFTRFTETAHYDAQENVENLVRHKFTELALN
jgi:hypothetical protein